MQHAATTFKTTCKVVYIDNNNICLDVKIRKNTKTFADDGDDFENDNDDDDIENAGGKITTQVVTTTHNWLVEYSALPIIDPAFTYVFEPSGKEPVSFEELIFKCIKRPPSALKRNVNAVIRQVCKLYGLRLPFQNNVLNNFVVTSLDKLEEMPDYEMMKRAAVALQHSFYCHEFYDLIGTVSFDVLVTMSTHVILALHDKQRCHAARHLVNIDIYQPSWNCELRADVVSGKWFDFKAKMIPSWSWIMDVMQLSAEEVILLSSVPAEMGKDYDIEWNRISAHPLVCEVNHDLNGNCFTSYKLLEDVKKAIDFVNAFSAKITLCNSTEVKWQIAKDVPNQNAMLIIIPDPMISFTPPFPSNYREFKLGEFLDEIDRWKEGRIQIDSVLESMSGVVFLDMQVFPLDMLLKCMAYITNRLFTDSRMKRLFTVYMSGLRTARGSVGFFHELYYQAHPDKVKFFKKAAFLAAFKRGMSLNTPIKANNSTDMIYTAIARPFDMLFPVAVELWKRLTGTSSAKCIVVFSSNTAQSDIDIHFPPSAYEVLTVGSLVLNDDDCVPSVVTNLYYRKSGVLRNLESFHLTKDAALAASIYYETADSVSNKEEPKCLGSCPLSILRPFVIGSQFVQSFSHVTYVNTRVDGFIERDMSLLYYLCAGRLVVLSAQDAIDASCLISSDDLNIVTMTEKYFN